MTTGLEQCLTAPEMVVLSTQYTTTYTSIRSPTGYARVDVQMRIQPLERLGFALYWQHFHRTVIVDTVLT
jgi:hypothetical protein